MERNLACTALGWVAAGAVWAVQDEPVAGAGGTVPQTSDPIRTPALSWEGGGCHSGCGDPTCTLEQSLENTQRPVSRESDDGGGAQDCQERWGRKARGVLFIYLFVCLSRFLFRAAPVTYGGSQARGPVGAVAAGLHPSHTGSELNLPPTPRLMATPDP